MKRRNLLKMLGMSPALLVLWKPATEQLAPPVAAPPPVQPAKLSLDEALSMVDWEEFALPKLGDELLVSTGPDTSAWTAMRHVHATSLSGGIEHMLPASIDWGDDDGPV